MTPVATGTATISYTVTNSCGTASATYTITVNPLPTAGTISGATSVCVGLTIPLTDATSGGNWTSSATSIATVGAGTGIVTGEAGGACTISYSVTNSCGTAHATYAITVNPLPNAGTIGGVSAVCLSSTTTLTDASSGGVWTSSITTVATINPGTGVVSPVAAGTTTITYTVTNVCGTVFATHTITVDATSTATIGPAMGSFTDYGIHTTGSEHQFCDLETHADLVGTPSGGTFSVVDPYMTGYATIGATSGVITPNPSVITPASVFKIGGFIYTVTNACGTGSAEWEVFIDAATINPFINPSSGYSWSHGSTVYYQGIFEASPTTTCAYAWCQYYTVTNATGVSPFSYMGGTVANEVEITVPSPGTVFYIDYRITNTCNASPGFSAPTVNATSY